MVSMCHLMFIILEDRSYHVDPITNWLILANSTDKRICNQNRNLSRILRLKLTFLLYLRISVLHLDKNTRDKDRYITAGVTCQQRDDYTS